MTYGGALTRHLGTKVALLFTLVGCSGGSQGTSASDSGTEPDSGVDAEPGPAAETGAETGSLEAATGDSGACSQSVPERRLAVGLSWACALRSDHVAECWGTPVPDQGQTHPPSTMLGAISAGDDNGACALTPAGARTCWGGTAPAPATLTAVDVSGGAGNGCMLGTCGDVECWGIDEMVAVPTGVRFSRIAAGFDFACGIDAASRAIRCWGRNDSGQLDAPTGAFTEIGAGAYHACAVASDGTLRCWGAGSSSGPPDAGLDGGNMNAVYAGQAIAPAGTFRFVAGGYANTCAIHTDGTVACWGAGTSNSNCTPAAVECGESIPPSGAFQEVRPGYTNTCGLRTDGGLSCWGSNTGGRSTPPADFQ